MCSCRCLFLVGWWVLGGAQGWTWPILAPEMGVHGAGGYRGGGGERGLRVFEGMGANGDGVFGDRVFGDRVTWVPAPAPVAEEEAQPQEQGCAPQAPPQAPHKPCKNMQLGPPPRRQDGGDSGDSRDTLTCVMSSISRWR